MAAATTLDDDVAVILGDEDIEFEYIGGDTDPGARLNLGEDASGGADTYPGGGRRAGADAAVDAHDQTLLKRQLSAARTEIQVLLNQLADFGRIRAQALARAHEIEALKARTVNLESESDQLRDHLTHARARMAEIEAAAREAREARAGSGGAADASQAAELEATRAALADVAAERDAFERELALAQAASARLAEAEAAAGGERAAAARMHEQVRALEVAVHEAQADLEASRRRRAELEEQVDELLLEVGAAQERAGASVQADDARVGELERQIHELQASAGELSERFSAAETARVEASERAERTRVALERLRVAYGRAQESEQRAEHLATELEGLRASNDVAQQRITSLERALAAEQARLDSGSAPGGSAGSDELARARHALAAAERERDALEARLERLEDELVRERKVSDELEARAEAAESVGRVQQAVAAEPSGGGQKTKEFEAEVQRLRTMVHSSSSQIQRYLLELEGAKGAIARNRQEAVRYAQRVSGLHEGIGHLDRYLTDAGPPAEQALVLLQEVKRCAGELRALAESNDRFGKAMERAMERLGQILKDSSR